MIDLTKSTPRTAYLVRSDDKPFKSRMASVYRNTDIMTQAYQSQVSDMLALPRSEHRFTVVR